MELGECFGASLLSELRRTLRSYLTFGATEKVSELTYIRSFGIVLKLINIWSHGYIYKYKCISINRVSDADADANTDAMDAIDFAGRERGRGRDEIF